MFKAKYTVVLANIMNDSKGSELLQRALSTYPVYVPQNPMRYSLIPTREEINRKLLNHYKYREIGFETVGRFLDELQITMEEIMPYYYQLMKSEDIMNEIDDPFGNVNIVEEYSETRSEDKQGTSSLSGSGSDTTTTTSDTSSTMNDTLTRSESGTSSLDKDITENSKRVKADTPQSELSIGTKGINNVGYASEAEWNENIGNSKEEGSTSGQSNETHTSESSGEANGESKSNTTTSSEGETTEQTQGTLEHTFTKKGNQGVNTYAHDMLEFRELFQNIVQKIINDDRIQELFMQVY